MVLQARSPRQGQLRVGAWADGLVEWRPPGDPHTWAVGWEPAMIEELRAEILSRAPPVGLHVRLVAIDGRGGAGKSTLAAQLGPSLSAEILHTDDFASRDNPLNWWPRLIAEALEPIRDGARTLSYQRGSWGPEHSPEPVLGQRITEVMILEGVSSSRREFRPYLTYSIWVDTPRDLCLQRGIERDGADQAEDWARWQADEDAYLARDDPRGFADRVVRGY